MADEIYRPVDLGRLADEIVETSSRILLHETGLGDRTTAPAGPRRSDATAGILEMPSVFPVGDRVDASRTLGETSSARRNRAISEESRDGERRVATVPVDGRPVTTEVVRANGKIQDLRWFNAEGKEGIHIVRDAASGKLKIDGPVDADAMKTLTRLGVKVGKDGSIQGEIEVTSARDLKYTDQPGSPKRVVTHLNADGTSSKVEMGRYVKTEFDAAGKESATLAWNGRKWAPVRKEDIAEAKVSPDGKSSTTSVVFRNADGTVAKTVGRTVGTADGDQRNLATFAYPGGARKSYDWNNALCRDDNSGRVCGKDAFGRYSENRDNWARTLPDGGKEYRKDGCTVTKDAEHRFTSITTADQPGAKGKKLDVKYDAHGDVRSVSIGGKTYERVGPEKNPGLARHLGRGEQEDVFKASGKFNRWVCKEDGTSKNFNIGITESGKVMLKAPGERGKDYDLSRGVAREKSASLGALEKELAGKTPESPHRVGERHAPDAATLSGLEKLRLSLDATKRLSDVVGKLAPQERAALYKSLEAIAKTDLRMTGPEEEQHARRGLQRMLFSAMPNPLDAITPREAQAVRQLLRRVATGRR